MKQAFNVSVLEANKKVIALLSDPARNPHAAGYPNQCLIPASAIVVDGVKLNYNDLMIAATGLTKEEIRAQNEVLVKTNKLEQGPGPFRGNIKLGLPGSFAAAKTIKENTPKPIKLTGDAKKNQKAASVIGQLLKK